MYISGVSGGTLKMKNIEERLSTPIRGECDVLVAGGGIAGIAAALAAARQGGKKVLLVENEFSLGGLATLGIVTIYLPLCDGCGHQVIYGIGEELLRLSVKYGIEDKNPAAWLEDGHTDEERVKNRFEAQYNPNMFMLEAEKLLTDAGVKILYGTKICSALTVENRVTAVIVENKSGRYGIEVKAAVDATGDADLSHCAGAKTENFAQGNILAGWYYSLSRGVKKLNMLGFCDIPDDEKKDGKTVKTLTDRRFSGLSGEELSEQMLLSHTSILNNFKQKRAEAPDTEITLTATIPQIRMTRRIVGSATMDTEDDRLHREDSVGLTGNWKVRGPIYEIPLGAIASVNIGNLFAAGRMISATDRMWDVTRVIPTCAVTGEAAGIAAVLAAEGDGKGGVNVRELQKRLVRGGVKLHVSDVLS